MFAIAMSEIQTRKTDHLDLAARGDVAFRAKTPLFGDVELVHCALPELEFSSVDFSSQVLGKRLRSPLLIAALTGGTSRAGEINRGLAQVAAARGMAFGLGSQRPMLLREDARATFQVRSAEGDLLLLGNIGVVQAAALSSVEVQRLVDDVQADALCVHLNPAMEIIQPGGDRDFRGGFATLERLAKELSVPVIAKETGCGLSREVAQQLRRVGVTAVDVSGAGGTSWVAVETQRAAGAQRDLGQQLWDWGIPTAASLLAVRGCGFQTVIATGGVQSGLDAAKAIALGAHLVGIARPVLQAWERGGEAEVHRILDQIELELRSVMLLVGAGSLSALRRVPRLIRRELREWNELWSAGG